MLRPNGVKDKKYCGFHDKNSHSINECRVFRVKIQKAIQEGHVVWTSLGPLPWWVPGPTTRWAPGSTWLALHGT
jgi:hypothetical protein